MLPTLTSAGEQGLEEVGRGPKVTRTQILPLVSFSGFPLEGARAPPVPSPAAPAQMNSRASPRDERFRSMRL